MERAGDFAVCPSVGYQLGDLLLSWSETAEVPSGWPVSHSTTEPAQLSDGLPPVSLRSAGRQLLLGSLELPQAPGTLARLG